jgi:hypothetical protein
MPGKRILSQPPLGALQRSPAGAVGFFQVQKLHGQFKWFFCKLGGGTHPRIRACIFRFSDSIMDTSISAYSRVLRDPISKNTKRSTEKECRESFANISLSSCYQSWNDHQTWFLWQTVGYLNTVTWCYTSQCRRPITDKHVLYYHTFNINNIWCLVGHSFK